MGRTSVPCSDETRELLVDEKQEDETWNDCLVRLVNQMPAQNEDVAAVLERLDELEAMLNEFEAGEGGEMPEMNVLREAIRAEVKNAVSDAIPSMAH
jgi:hypothetical protein